jgi:dTDP-4-amino-4,6-dideoxygalactose transaminase
MSVPALTEKLVAADKAGRLPDLVIPVDFAGFAVDLKEIRELADRYGFKILEDASHATGASYLGEPVGSAYAHATVFSFHAVKVVTTAEGGMITTDDDELAREFRLLRSHGMTREPDQMEGEPEGGWYYEQIALGYNYRLTDLQSALGLSQLDRLDQWQRRRAEIADRYDRLFAGMPLKLPARLQDRESAWHLYAIELGDDVAASRADVFAGMREAGIGVNVHYIPIHTQPQYRRLGFKRGDFANAERYYDRAISIPLFPAMTDEQQQKVVDTLRGLIG